jgi:hypothetical protein
VQNTLPEASCQQMIAVMQIAKHRLPDNLPLAIVPLMTRARSTLPVNEKASIAQTIPSPAIKEAAN